jgi:hypothetical protein
MSFNLGSPEVSRLTALDDSKSEQSAHSARIDDSTPKGSEGVLSNTLDALEGSSSDHLIEDYMISRSSYISILHRLHTNGRHFEYSCYNYGSALSALTKYCDISKFDHILFKKNFYMEDDVDENEYRFEQQYMLKIYDILRYGLKIEHKCQIDWDTSNNFNVLNPQNVGKFDEYGGDIIYCVTCENKSFDVSHLESQIPQIAKALFSGKNIECIVQDDIVTPRIY